MPVELLLVGVLLIGFILSFIFQKPKYRDHPAFTALIVVVTLYFIYLTLFEGGGWGSLFFALIGVALLVKKFIPSKKTAQ